MRKSSYNLIIFLSFFPFPNFKYCLMLLSLCLFFHDKVGLLSEVKLLIVTAGDADSQASHDDRR